MISAMNVLLLNTALPGICIENLIFESHSTKCCFGDNEEHHFKFKICK